MKNKQLEQLVLESKDDKQKLNDLIEAYKPFIASCAQKLSGKYLTYGSDDELSIAMMAFVQAVHGYRTESGEFLSYASTIIRNKIIDYYRNQKKHNDKVVYIHNNDDKVEGRIDTQVSMAVYDEEREHQERLLEIKQLKENLNRYDISLFELEKVSPKNRKTKNVCNDVISYIQSNPVLLNDVLVHKNLPLSQIEKGLFIKRKKFERHRKYIMTVLIIKSGNYPYLEAYVK